MSKKEGKQDEKLQKLFDEHNKASNGQEKKVIEKDILREFNFIRFHICENETGPKKIVGADIHDHFFEWHVFHGGNL